MFNIQSILPHAENKGSYEAKIDESEKASIRQESNPGHPRLPSFPFSSIQKSSYMLITTAQHLLMLCTFRVHKALLYTVKTYGLLQPHFGHLSCIPVV